MVDKVDNLKRELCSHVAIFHFQKADQVQSGSYFIIKLSPAAVGGLFYNMGYFDSSGNSFCWL